MFLYLKHIYLRTILLGPSYTILAGTPLAQQMQCASSRGCRDWRGQEGLCWTPQVRAEQAAVNADTSHSPNKYLRVPLIPK